jgi:hypothetical protein
MFAGFTISLLIALLASLKLVGFLVHHHAAVMNGKYEGVGAEINIGVILSSVAWTAVVIFHHNL